jgi:hypothetical protein
LAFLHQIVANHPQAGELLEWAADEGATVKQLREADAKRWTQEAVGALLGVARNTVSDWFTNVGGDESKSPPPDARVKRRAGAPRWQAGQDH